MRHHNRFAAIEEWPIAHPNRRIVVIDTLDQTNEENPKPHPRIILLLMAGEENIGPKLLGETLQARFQCP
jgi:hypothetical protein